MNVVNTIKELNIEIGKQMFRIHPGQERPSPLQFQIMNYLIQHQNEPVCQKDIEQHFRLSKATVSKGLSAMENKGIIKRVVDQNDARSKNIIFTEDACEHFKQMKVYVQQLNDILIKNIEEDDLMIFMDVMQKMILNIKEVEHD